MLGRSGDPAGLIVDSGTIVYDGLGIGGAWAWFGISEFGFCVVDFVV